MWLSARGRWWGLLGSKSGFAWAPSAWTHRDPGLQTSLVTGLSLHLPVEEDKFSSAASDGTFPLLPTPFPPCIGVRGTTSPGWWISCLTLLSWMIWGIIQKVRHFRCLFSRNDFLRNIFCSAVEMSSVLKGDCSTIELIRTEM